MNKQKIGCEGVLKLFVCAIMFGKNNAGVSDHLDEQRFETWFKK
jgi:hypothetical protein